MTTSYLSDHAKSVGRSYLQLNDVVAEVQRKRMERGEAPIRDLDSFVMDLSELAKEYREKTDEANALKEALVQYAEVAKAARRLSDVMSGLSGAGMKLLVDAQDRQFAKYSSGGDPDAVQRCTDIGYQGGLATAWQVHDALSFLELGAAALSTRKRGRPKNEAERKVAEKFVILCHQYGWKRISMASSPTLSKRESDMKRSDVVRCLALIFAMGGASMIVAEQKAQSTLSRIQDEGFVYVSPEVVDEHDRIIAESEFCRVTLFGMVSESDVRLRSLPNFVPPSPE